MSLNTRNGRPSLHQHKKQVTIPFPQLPEEDRREVIELLRDSASVSNVHWSEVYTSAALWLEGAIYVNRNRG